MGSIEAVHPLRIFFFPLMAPGHMNPILNIAKLFSLRGDVAATVVLTPGNEPRARPSIDAFNASAAKHHPVEILILPFPAAAADRLPSGQENLSAISNADHGSMFQAIDSLRDPFAELVRSRRPDCIISDAMLPWTAGVAAAIGVPRIVFHGHGAFAHCVHESLELHQYQPFGSGDEDDEDRPFHVEGLPDEIELRDSEVLGTLKYPALVRLLRDAEECSFGVIVNTFYQLEPAYAELYLSMRPRRRAWFVGPASLCDGDDVKPSTAELRSLTAWLGTKPAGSVVYVCFGSLCELARDQVRELARGLEMSGHDFVWAVRDDKGSSAAEMLPEGFQAACGYVVRGWAPQVAILGHMAMGGFVTHCGWNSTLEAVVAGLPMATWPMEHEQFVNEKLITQVLNVGVSVRGGGKAAAVVSAERVAAAVKRVMGDGEEAQGMRRRAAELAGLAKAAVYGGGSSHADLGRLVDELLRCRAAAAAAAIDGSPTQNGEFCNSTAKGSVVAGVSMLMTEN